MSNPLIIGGLMVGGAIAAWRLMRERGRIRRMAAHLVGEAKRAESGRIIRLERDPETGIYAPREDG